MYIYIFYGSKYIADLFNNDDLGTSLRNVLYYVVSASLLALLPQIPYVDTVIDGERLIRSVYTGLAFMYFVLFLLSSPFNVFADEDAQKHISERLFPLKTVAWIGTIAFAYKLNIYPYILINISLVYGKWLMCMVQVVCVIRIAYDARKRTSDRLMVSGGATGMIFGGCLVAFLYSGADIALGLVVLIFGYNLVAGYLEKASLFTSAIVTGYTVSLFVTPANYQYIVPIVMCILHILCSDDTLTHLIMSIVSAFTMYHISVDETVPALTISYATGCIYIWTLVAPLVLKDRVFENYED
jgi:hypothetical protein